MRQSLKSTGLTTHEMSRDFTSFDVFIHSISKSVVFVGGEISGLGGSACVVSSLYDIDMTSAF